MYILIISNILIIMCNARWCCLSVCTTLAKRLLLNCKKEEMDACAAYLMCVWWWYAFLFLYDPRCALGLPDPPIRCSALQAAGTEHTMSVEGTNPDSWVMVLGDFNKIIAQSNFQGTVYQMPDQREEHVGSLLHYCSKQSRRPPRCTGCLWPRHLHPIPAYRQKLHICKPVARTCKKWTSEAAEDLRTCLDWTDWLVFRTATSSLGE